MLQRVYIDTSVIGGCFDEEFQDWSNQLIEEIKSGQIIAVISDITYREIELAPKNIQDILFNIPEDFIENIITDKEVETLAKNYIKAGAVSQRFYKYA